MSKLMGFAGRDESDIARAIKTNVNGNLEIESTGNIVEEVLDNEKVLAKGSSLSYEFDMGDYAGYRIFIAPTEADAHITVRPLTDFFTGLAAYEESTYKAPIIESKGTGSVTIGNSNSGTNVEDFKGRSLWSEIIIPYRKKQKIRFVHPSASPVDTLTYKIIVVKYKSISETKANTSANSNDGKTSTDFTEQSIAAFKQNYNIEPNTDFPSLTGDDALVFDYPVVIDHLEWQTDVRTRMRIYIDIKVNGSWVTLTRSAGRVANSDVIHTPEYIQLLKSSMWEILDFDAESTDKFFKFSLRKPIHAPEGIRIYLQNESPEWSYSGVISLHGRRLG